MFVRFEISMTGSIVTSYLSNRKMSVRYNEATSDKQSVTGGGPQGGLLVVLLFNLQVNLAGAPRFLQPVLPVGVHGLELGNLQPGPPLLCPHKEKLLKKKYVDDLGLLESIDLKNTLKPKPQIIGPPRPGNSCLSYKPHLK